MKKIFAMLMTLCVLLTGCATQEKKTETPKIAENQAEEVVVPEEIVSETEETTAPTQPEETPEAPEEPEEPEEPAPEEPAAPVESAPTQPSTPVESTPAPQPSTPVQSTPAPQQSTTNSRPTSRSTSKDTGSNKKWDYPAVHNWEETDPQRTSYISTNTNSTYPTSLAGNGGVLMFVGHTYGMKFLHDGDASDLRWYSSDASVATVNQVGFVTPLKQGVTEIGFYFDGQRYKRTVYVFLEPDFTEAQLEQMAKEEAKRIAEYVMSLPVNTDIERIAAAALIINKFVAKGSSPTYTIYDDGSVVCNVPGYNRPFGTLITGYSTCAGDARALGMILEYMGFEWYLVNANQWDHQWCVVYDVDGQTAFADGAYLGIAGYGERQEDGSNWLQYNLPIEYNIQTVL